MSSALGKLKSWFRRTADSGEEVAEGGEPVATPPPGASARTGDTERETSTNAQVEGAVGEPWNSDG
jgi:hypothetical protein